MTQINTDVTPRDLVLGATDVARVAAASSRTLASRWPEDRGTPVFTVGGEYTTRGWTEWTQGFQYGIAILAGEMLGDDERIAWARAKTIERMAPHLTHTGVHDHGFNNVSTYGNLLRLARGSVADNSAGGAAKNTVGAGSPIGTASETDFYELALKVSGAVQVARWTELPDELGYVPSFNGAHSLFADTIRSMRSPAVAYKIGHKLLGEQDKNISLLRRLLQHAETTARYNVYFGTGRDGYDVAGRVVHESIFNPKSGSYRCPSTQQGYSPFTTWTRGLSWVVTGFAELVEFALLLTDDEVAKAGLSYFATKKQLLERLLSVAVMTGNFFLDCSCSDGVPYWDTGAPGIDPETLKKPASPYTVTEPIDASASAIAASGLLRMGHCLTKRRGELEAAGVAVAGPLSEEVGRRLYQGGLTIASTLFGDTYLATDEGHEGVLLHSVYHHPNRWDHIPEGASAPAGESSMWGDYHLVELALLISRLADGGYYSPFDCVAGR